MRRICVYGSLRKNEYNHNRMIDNYGEQSIIYEKTVEIDGYNLYSLGSYPGVKHGDGKLTVDVLLVEDAVYSIIWNMEKNANYSQVVVTVDDRNCIIFTYNGKVNEKNLVKSGNWSEHLKLQEQEV